MMRAICLVLVFLLAGLGSPASAEWTTGTGYASFASAPICTVQSRMAGDASYQRYPEYEHAYLTLVLADPYCPIIYLQEPLIFHGWLPSVLPEEGACFTSSFLLADATLCLSDPQIVDMVLHNFDATLCVDPVSEGWCTEGTVIFALA